VHWLSDVSVGSAILSLLAIGASALSFALTWRDYRNGWKIAIRTKAIFLTLLLVLCIAAGWDAYNPDADQPHIRRTGRLIPKYPAIFHHRHDSDTHGVLACVDSCTGDVPLISMGQFLTQDWQNAGMQRPYTVVHLGRKDDVDIGSSLMTAHPMVEMIDPTTGREMYYIDTTRHWSRLILLSTGALLCLLSLIVCSKIAATNPDLDENPAPTRYSEMPVPDGLTHLDLEGADKN